MILNPLTQERMFEIHEHPLSICELSRFSPGCPPTGGQLVAAVDRHEAFRLFTSQIHPATYPGYHYPIKHVIFDHRKELLYMNSLQYYKNLDEWPFTGVRSVDFQAMVALNDLTRPFFNGSANHTQVKDVTPGKIYPITEVEGFSDVADFHFINDAGIKTSLGSFFFEEPPVTPCEKRHENELRVKIQGGYLVATPSCDPDYPGIDIEFQPDKEGPLYTLPRVLMEKPAGKNLRALIWADPASEDYTSEINFQE